MKIVKGGRVPEFIPLYALIAFFNESQWIKGSLHSDNQSM